MNFRVWVWVRAEEKVRKKQLFKIIIWISKNQYDYLTVSI